MEQPLNQDVEEQLAEYFAIFPEDRDTLKPLRQQLDNAEDISNRTNFYGHICGSGIILSSDRNSIALIEHATFKRWQQPGGHMEPGDTGPLATALRESSEETGLLLKSDSLLPWSHRKITIPIQIALHTVPQNPIKDEPEHYHYDFRYVFQAAATHLAPPFDEVDGAAWIPTTDPKLNHLDVTLGRLRKYRLIA